MLLVTHNIQSASSIIFESCWVFCAKLLFRNTGLLSFDQLPIIAWLTSIHRPRPRVDVSSMEKASLPGLSSELCTAHGLDSSAAVL